MVEASWSSSFFMEVRRLPVLFPQQAIPVMAIVGFSSVGQPTDGTGPVAERVDLNLVCLKNSDLRWFLCSLLDVLRLTEATAAHRESAIDRGRERKRETIIISEDVPVRTAKRGREIYALERQACRFQQMRCNSLLQFVLLSAAGIVVPPVRFYSFFVT